jgi:hypothetical protein
VDVVDVGEAVPGARPEQATTIAAMTTIDMQARIVPTRDPWA